MIIKDALHGFITVDENEKGILDSEIFQRLRYVRQLALARLVYPGANHTRFEHSLGVMHLAGRIAERLGLDKGKARIIGLLHDIGHPAFSHEGERALGINHEKEMVRMVRNLDIPNYTVEELIHSPEEKIVSGDLGADRLDYLRRDSYYTGVAYGIIDEGRIIHTLTFDGELAITRRGLEAAESLLLARFMMFFTVYLHKTVRVASSMLRAAIKESISSGALEKEDFFKYGDDFLLAKMAEEGNTLAERLLRRNLMKVLFSISYEKPLVKELENLNLPNVLVDVPSSVYRMSGFYVVDEEKKKEISKVSSILSALKRAEKEKLTILIIGERERKDDVERELRYVLRK